MDADVASCKVVIGNAVQSQPSALTLDTGPSSRSRTGMSACLLGAVAGNKDLHLETSRDI